MIIKSDDGGDHGNVGRKRGKDALDLNSLCIGEALELVVGINDRHRLNEKCCAG